MIDLLAGIRFESIGMGNIGTALEKLFFHRSIFLVMPVRLTLFFNTSTVAKKSDSVFSRKGSAGIFRLKSVFPPHSCNSRPYIRRIRDVSFNFEGDHASAWRNNWYGFLATGNFILRSSATFLRCVIQRELDRNSWIVDYKPDIIRL